MTILFTRRKFLQTSRSPAAASIGSQGLISTLVGTNPTTDPPTDPLYLFRMEPSLPNANGTMMYNFAGGFTSGLGTTWTKTHEATGGPGGRPCVNITWLEQSGTFQQVSYGWWAPVLPYTFVDGDWMFVYMLIRYHNEMRWFDSGAQHKMCIWGDDAGGSRVIPYGNYPSSQRGGSLGWRQNGGTGAFYPFAIPSHFGLSGINNDWGNANGIYGSVKIGWNIETDCAGPALVTYGSNPNPPVPGTNSAAPTAGDCWYYIVYGARAGNIATHDFRVWVNNPDFDNPTASLPATERVHTLPPTLWHVNPNIGTYLDRAAPAGAGFRVADVRISRGWDPTFYLS